MYKIDTQWEFAVWLWELKLGVYNSIEVRGGGQEEQLHIQGAVAEWAQEGQAELLHVQGQEGQPWGDIPRPSKEQRLHLAGAAVKGYPMTKIRETQVRW